jgi:hypothetical protein
VLLPALGSLSIPGRAADATPEALAFFEKKIRPVLVEHCHRCHSSQVKKPKGGLFLDTRSGLLKGGDGGPVVVPGEPQKSRLVEAIRYKNVDLQMPPKGILPEAVIADLTAWIKMGAPWPPEEGLKAAAGVGAFDLEGRRRTHWAWQPVRPQQPPPIKNKAWPRGPEDAFILAKLEERGLVPAPPADKRTLLRRVYFDLVGLPPTPAEVNDFLQDTSADAFEKVVDRLLASPHFGERWARHWLDLVRYAETRGHEYDYPIPNAHQYRDYVIRAFNEDVPYNHFVMEHVAGDLLEKPRLHATQGYNESILGTGFWLLGEELHSPVDTRQDQADRFDNRIDVLTKTFLGLTVACARCHDHKFDAISTKDYYALFGIVESSTYRLARFDSMEHNRRIAEQLWKLREQGRPPIQWALAAAVRPALDRLADYLLATRDVLLSESAGTRSRRGVEEVARARHLDAGLLQKWMAVVDDAVKDSNDPLYAWAQVAADARAGEPKRLAELLGPLVERWRKRQAEAAVALAGAEVVVDYARLAPEQWLPDGVTFGPGPVRPGEVRLSADSGQPIVKFFDCAAAEKDVTWDRLKPAAGAENDPGALAAVVRAGRTLHTPAFQVSSGKVFYLVKGNGQAYVAVDAHVMIAGPLHGKLVSAFKAGDGFQWIQHDLSAYKGHRTHIEFTATDGSEFAVAMVVQAANAPGSIERPNQPLLQMLAEVSLVEGLATGYQRLLTEVTKRLETDRLIGSREAADYARLANWLVQKESLFIAGEGEAKRPLSEAARSFITDQAKLLAQIENSSRLGLALLDSTGVNELVFIRGSPKALGERVERRFLEALAGPQPLRIARGSGRLELARQITDPAVNPFLARVLVNRVWHHLFDRGIVASVDNFGVLGDRPTHPELLDHLADQFVRQGWSIKKLIRTLVLSSTYRMSSHPEERADQADPENLLLHRMRLRRLEGETIRDALLAVSGRLSSRIYGASVPVYLTPFQDGRGRPESGRLDGDGRRSVYLASRRNFLSPLLLAFDAPIPFSTVGRRTVSNVPAQSLILLNDPFAHQQAELWAKQALSQDALPRERIALMYEQAFARLPSESETAACLAFLKQQNQLAMATGGRRFPVDDLAAWTDLAHVLFNVKEFIFVN